MTLNDRNALDDLVGRYGVAVLLDEMTNITARKALEEETPDKDCGRSRCWSVQSAILFSASKRLERYKENVK